MNSKGLYMNRLIDLCYELHELKLNIINHLEPTNSSGFIFSNSDLLFVVKLKYEQEKLSNYSIVSTSLSFFLLLCGL